MFVRQIVNLKAGFPNSSEQYTKILGMLRRLTYISGFFREAQYVVPSAVRPTATCLVSQARISLTSFGGWATKPWSASKTRDRHRPLPSPIGLCKRCIVWMRRKDLKSHVLGDRSIFEIRMFAKGI